MDPKAFAKCGTPVDAEYAGGLCPAYLLKDGLEAVPRLRCHACHDTLADDMRFCGHCGAPVPARAERSRRVEMLKTGSMTVDSSS